MGDGTAFWNPNDWDRVEPVLGRSDRAVFEALTACGKDAQLVTQILIHTPAWVYVLFVVLVIFGLQQTRSRNVSAVLAYILPLGMTVLSVVGVNSSFGFRPASLVMWACGLIIIAVVGFTRYRDGRVRFSRSSRRFYVPGSWAPFWVIMAIFFTKYLCAIMLALGAEIVTTWTFVAVLSLVYGCYSGYFVSRAVIFFYKAQSA